MEPAKQFGIGIIGLGMIADFHARAIQELTGCRLVAGYQPNVTRGEAFCDTRHCKYYADLDQFLADPSLDVVIIATPSGLHLDGALAAIQAGKQVIVEKPLEITTERCDRILSAATNRNVRLCTVFPSRYFDASQLIKAAVDQGRFGRIVLADAQVKWHRSQKYYDSGAWRGTWQFDGGGALMNQGIHAIDLLQWLVGDVAEVSAYTATLAHERIEVEDTAVAALKFTNGALGMIEGTTGAYPGFLKKLEICGTHGSVILEEESLIHWAFDVEQPEDQAIREQYLYGTHTGGGSADPKAIGAEGHRRVIGGFLDTLRTGVPFGLEGAEGRKSVALIEQIYRSARAGAPMRMA